MNENEFWFLDLVVRCLYPLDWMAEYPEDVEAHTNELHHGLSGIEVQGVLAGLFSRGDLFARLPGDRPSAHFMPTESEIQAGLAGTTEIYLGLTQQDGERREKFSCPNWDLYLVEQILGDEGENDAINIEVLCTDHSLIGERLSLCESQTLNLTCDVVSPWDATYWKTLPTAHRARFQHSRFACRESALSTGERICAYYRREQAKREMQDRLSQWRAHPWRIPWMVTNPGVL